MSGKHRVAQLEGKCAIKIYLENTLGYSPRQAKKLLKEKRVFLNGKKAFWDNTVKNGDTLEVQELDEKTQDILPQDMNLQIIYEDEYFLVVNKPPFMLVHPTEKHPQGTLANGIRAYFDKKGEKTPIRFLNRIDMNTSGLVLLPKSGSYHAALMGLMEAGGIRKLYYALIEGNIEPTEGRIDLPIGLDEADGIKRCVTADGQPSITLYKLITRMDKADLLELELLTGRTHQIRVHLSHLGHPIIGDTLYGKEDLLIGRQALHAARMQFIHPFTKAELILEAPLPGDMKMLMQALDGKEQQIEGV